MKDEIEISLMKRRKVKDYIQTLNVVYKQVNRSIDIIKSMLYLAKAEAGVISVNLREVNIPELIREVILTLNHKAKRKNIKVKFNCDSVLISKTDENILFDALRNILDNAIEYTEKGGSVEIKCEKVEEWLKISISDAGIGIGADDLPYIFDRFYRGRHALELNPTGTGLGLALTKSMIDLLKGKISVSSEIGKGTTFVVQIPA
jgi:two-component system phosphate regulon sensor histidine kinase PhoR